MRKAVKQILFFLSRAAVFPVYLAFLTGCRFLDREAAFQGPSQFMSLIPGRPGSFLRAAFYALSLRRCSQECTISFGTIFSTPDCEIGRHAYVGAYCVISDCIIGDDALIGSHVHVISGKHAHGFADAATPMRLQRTSRREIRVGENSWIGNGAIVLADVGPGSVVGAGSVVTRPVAENSVVAGNPARVIRTRTDVVRA